MDACNSNPANIKKELFMSNICRKHIFNFREIVHLSPLSSTFISPYEPAPHVRPPRVPTPWRRALVGLRRTHSLHSIQKTLQELVLPAFHTAIITVILTYNVIVLCSQPRLVVVRRDIFRKIVDHRCSRIHYFPL